MGAFDPYWRITKTFGRGYEMSVRLETEDEKNLKQQPRSRFYVWVVAACIAGLSVYAGTRIYSGERAAGQSPRFRMSVPVVASVAKKGDIPVYVTGLGTVTALYTSTVLTQVNGQVLKVPFKEGDIVKKGSLLVQIDPAPYEATLIQAQGQLARDKALLAEAKRDLKRYDVLVKQDSIAQQQRDDQLYLVQQDEGTVQLDEGLVKSAQVNVDYTRITAPFTGRIGLRFVDPGNIVHTTDTNGMAVITQDQPITVIFPVPEENLPDIMKKLNAGESLTVEALIAPKIA